MKTPSPILQALDRRAYDYLEASNPELLAAIEAEVASGATPEAIKRKVAAYSPHAQELTVTIRQAAQHAARMIAG